MPCIVIDVAELIDIRRDKASATTIHGGRNQDPSHVLSAQV